MHQSRRRFLLTSSVALTSLAAGCTDTQEDMEGGDHNDGGGDDPTESEFESSPTRTPTMTPRPDDGDAEQSTPTRTPTATESPTPTPSPTPEAEANPRITGSTLKKQQSSYSTDAYIIATVTNEGSGVSGELKLVGRFYDSDGNLIDSSTKYLPYLKPGETWQADISFYGDAEEVQSHTTDGEYSTSPPRLSFEKIEPVDVRVRKGDYSVDAVGTMDNRYDETIDYLEATARFWDGDVILGRGLDNITDVPPGENWSFEAGFYGTSRQEENVTNVDVIPKVSIY